MEPALVFQWFLIAAIAAVASPTSSGRPVSPFVYETSAPFWSVSPESVTRSLLTRPK